MAGLLERLRDATRARGVTTTSLIAAVGDPALAARMSVRSSARARRVSLRVDAGAGTVVLVHPRRVSVRAALAFVASKRDWIAAALAALPPRVHFNDGAIVPLRGVPHVLRFASDRRGGVWREGETIVVTGRAEHASRRLVDWLKAEARTAIGTVARPMADDLGSHIARISVRDTTSRWGSCSRGGALSFSWRLMLAPDDVFVYVVAHEVAHLKHLNHGAAFWRTVERLMPEGAVAAKSAREWLRVNGAALHSYG